MPAKFDPDSTGADKIIALYSLLLFTGQSYSLTQLTRHLNCSKQTVLRHLAKLESSAYGRVICEKRGNQSWFCMERPTQRPQAALLPEQFADLLLCRDFVVHLLPKGLREDVDLALRHATTLLPDWKQAETLLDARNAQVITKGGIDYTPFQAMLSTLFAAIHQKSVCSVTYHAAAGKTASYDFAPMQVVAYRETLAAHGWVIQPMGAVLPKYEKPVRLLVHRLQQVALTRRTWKTLPPLESEVDAESFGIMPGEPFRVQVRFSASTADYVRERVWSRDQVVESLDCGVLLTLSAKNPREVLSWVLSFGAEAEVLSPESLRELVRDTLASLGRTYQIFETFEAPALP